MDKWVPSKLIDSWDNTGFQIGDEEREVKKVLVALDLDRPTLKKAIEENYQMVITHHPLIFKPLNRINSKDYTGRLIMDIIKNDIVVYNAHSNLDMAIDGVNDELARMFNLKDSKILRKVYHDELVKLAVYTPKDYADQIRFALGNSGAGHIGNYSHCTFNSDGIGTFLPTADAKPYIGKVGTLEKVEEVKVESILKREDLSHILAEVKKAHPYEEVAYDVYPLLNEGTAYGYGRVGYIEETEAEEFIYQVKDKLKVSDLTAYGNIDGTVSKVALCGGSGSNFIYDAHKAKADIYITGDLKYHDAQLAQELGMILLDAGHFHTEKIILPVIKKYLLEKLGEELSIKVLMESSLPEKTY